jgi:cytochrome P450
MVNPSDEVLKLREILRTGTEEEAAAARKRLNEIALEKIEERKKNPPPWGDDISF